MIQFGYLLENQTTRPWWDLNTFKPKGGEEIPMTKWEYKQVTATADDDDPDKIMADLGNEGWEVYQLEWDTLTVLCKRPKDTTPVLRPSRVVINKHGEAVSYREAKAKGFTPETIFVRDDGWSLGAPAGLIEVAESIWKDKWVTVIWKDTILSYDQYKTGESTVTQRVLESIKVNPNNFHGRIVTDKDEINQLIDDRMEKRPEIKALRKSLKIPDNA